MAKSETLVITMKVTFVVFSSQIFRLRHLAPFDWKFLQEKKGFATSILQERYLSTPNFGSNYILTRIKAAVVILLTAVAVLRSYRYCCGWWKIPPLLLNITPTFMTDFFKKCTLSHCSKDLAAVHFHYHDWLLSRPRSQCWDRPF